MANSNSDSSSDTFKKQVSPPISPSLVGSVPSTAQSPLPETAPDALLTAKDKLELSIEEAKFETHNSILWMV